MAWLPAAAGMGKNSGIHLIYQISSFTHTSHRMKPPVHVFSTAHMGLKWNLG